MGLLGRAARGPLGHAAIGAGIGAGAGGMIGNGDPNAIGVGALVGAGQGVGLGAVGGAMRREMMGIGGVEALDALKQEALKYVRDPRMQQQLALAETPDEVEQIVQMAVSTSRVRGQGIGS